MPKIEYQPLTPEFDKLLCDAYWYASQDSDDPRTKNAAVIFDPDSFDGQTYRVVEWGTNKMAPYTERTEEKLHTNLKYRYMIHAEDMAVLRMAGSLMPKSRRNTSWKKHMLAIWACCTGCANSIIVGGISCVYAHKEAHDRAPHHWKEETEAGIALLNEAGVRYVQLTGKLSKEIFHRFNGTYWIP